MAGIWMLADFLLQDKIRILVSLPEVERQVSALVEQLAATG
jgi:hypothetical protein